MKRGPPGAERTSRKLSSERDIELRRSKGEISCAECRRLKLKCDKKLPCSSCVRRGCSTICPNGNLSTGQGTRFVLADTEHLHRKITEMAQRIRQLEDALSIFQASVSNETHPLLNEELLAIKFGPELEAPTNPGPSTSTSKAPSVLLEALGTLTIDDSGESKYYGQSAGSETLMLAGAELDDTADEYSAVSSEVREVSSLVPVDFSGEQHLNQTGSAIGALLDQLPPYPRATTLCETYMEHITCVFRPMHRDEVINDTLAPVYKYARLRKEGNHNVLPFRPHKLSVLYMIFAHGALMDLTLPPYNPEAHKYYQLGRLALALQSLFDSPTIETIQMLGLMAYFQGNCGTKYTLDNAWCCISLASKLAQSIGLHRDPTRWNFDAKTVQRRRNLFWEIFFADLFHSLAIGRPPSLRMSYVDCKFPDAQGALEGLFRWKHAFTKDVYALVTELTQSTVPPSYATILELDRKVREHVLPHFTNIALDEPGAPLIFASGHALSQIRINTVIHIHRSFFAQAMLDYSANPLRTPYAPSFLAAYDSASSVIKTVKITFGYTPQLLARLWPVWTQLFSAAMIIGTIVTKSPSSAMAPAALVELDLAVDLFTKGAGNTGRARGCMVILNKLKMKAFQVHSQVRSGSIFTATDQKHVLQPEVEGQDELTMFSGQTRVLASKILSRSRRKVSSSDSPGSSTSTPPSSSDGELVPEVHQSLIEYLSRLPPAPSSSSSTSASASMFATPTMHTGQLNTTLNYGTQPTEVDMSCYSIPEVSSTQTFDQHAMFNDFSHTTDTIGSKPMGQMVDEAMTSVDMSLIMGGESGINEQWISFLRDNGMLDSYSGASMQ